MTFDWESMLMICLVDGKPMTDLHDLSHGRGGAPEPLPFGPHALLQALEADGGASASGLDVREAARRVREMRGGFTRLYLFTWLDGNAPPTAEDDDDEAAGGTTEGADGAAPDVGIADLFIE